MTGTKDKITGAAKEAIGKGTGDKRTEAEGKADRAKGHVKNAVEGVKESARGVKESLER